MSKKTAPKTEREIRIANINDFKIELREAEENSEMIIEGYAAVYDSETLIGSEDWGFYERIEKGAFEGADIKDVPLKYNHSDAVPILARTRNKSLEIIPDENGLFIRAKLLDTQDCIDMYKRIKAGLIDKMSFAFTVKEDAFTDGKTPKRAIKKFDRIYDVSVVDMPAYQDTSIYARSRELVETWRGALDNGTRKNPEERKENYALKILIKKYKGAKTQ